MLCITFISVKYKRVQKGDDVKVIRNRNKRLAYRLSHKIAWQTTFQNKNWVVIPHFNCHSIAKLTKNRECTHAFKNRPAAWV